MLTLERNSSTLSPSLEAVIITGRAERLLKEGMPRREIIAVLRTGWGSTPQKALGVACDYLIGKLKKRSKMTIGTTLFFHFKEAFGLTQLQIRGKRSKRQILTSDHPLSKHLPKSFKDDWGRSDSLVIKVGEESVEFQLYS